MAVTGDYKNSLIKGLKTAYKAYIEVYAQNFDFSGSDFTQPSVLYSRFLESTQTAKQIGAIQNLEIINERQLNIWRELDYKTAGRPVESYPGLPGYELSLDRIVLYDSMISDEFYSDVDDSIDISKQTRPLLIKINLICPDDEDKTSSDQLLTKTWFIYGVWFLDSNIEFGVDNVDDIKIIQNCRAKAAGIVGNK